MKTLKSELEQHAEVENELAKRSHFCNQVIKKYKAQIQTLKEEIKEQTLAAETGPPQKAKCSKAIETSKKSGGDFSKSDLTQFLQKRILDYERKQ